MMEFSKSMSARAPDFALPTPSFARSARDAFESFTNPKAVHKRRKAARLAALAEGRKALARLRSPSASGISAAKAPHLDAAISAIETLEAAVLSLDAIANRISDAAELVAAAEMEDGDQPLGDTDDDTGAMRDGARALLAERYDELRGDIDRIARTAYAGRTNLLDGLGGALNVPLDAEGRARALIPGTDATSAESGLALPCPEQAFATGTERQVVAQALAAATQVTRSLAARFEVDAALLAARIRELSA